MFENIKKEFPALNQTVHNRPLVYLDSAASTQKPVCVLNAVNNYYETINSNVHRGIHSLSQKATDAYEAARVKIQHFIHAEHSHEIVFTRGTTEAVNLVASTFGQLSLKQGDEIILSVMEHHSNIVPWQLVAEQYEAVIKVIPINQAGDLVLDEYKKLFSEKTKIAAFTHTSNVLGTINPIKEMIAVAHQHGVPVLIDGAQGIKSEQVDVQDLDCDFYCFSGHKMYAPMGIGVLYGKEKWLDKLPPYQGGGDMIEQVSFEKTIFNKLPFKFEAGTPNVGDAIGLAAAVDFITSCGLKNMIAYEKQLLNYALEQLQTIDNLRFIGNPKKQTAVVSFLLGDAHPSDVGTLVDYMGIAVRTGHHCAQPLMDFLQIAGTVRASFAVYNTLEDVDKLAAGVRKAGGMLG
ncbi:MAG: cysteine desulfurase [Lentimicrobiaceae bacterium]|nr:cysteine desulfurase [Lentimicrobiaceae bacterium]